MAAIDGPGWLVCCHSTQFPITRIGRRGMMMIKSLGLCLTTLQWTNYIICCSLLVFLLLPRLTTINRQGEEL